MFQRSVLDSSAYKVCPSSFDPLYPINASLGFVTPTLLRAFFSADRIQCQNKDHTELPSVQPIKVDDFLWENLKRLVHQMFNVLLCATIE